MVLVLLSALAFQVQPRFTMTTEPGDTIRAEIFEIEDGLTPERIQMLLGEAVLETDSLQEVPQTGQLRFISARRADGTVVGLVAAPGHPDASDKVCRATNDLPGTVNNAPRAARWCTSFFNPPVVRIPPPPAD